jgi:hypothetical protein
LAAAARTQRQDGLGDHEMEIDLGGTRRAPAYFQPGVSPQRAFADAMGGTVLSGLLYCLVVAWFHPGGLELAWMRVIALALIFGGFEVWRVARERTPRCVGTRMLWTLAASVALLWVLGWCVPLHGPLRMS